jgi:16S rRNA (uracil1498-N3)-methyltransferase
MAGARSFNESLLMIIRCPIIPGVMRRFHTPRLVIGLNVLDARQGKHARDVLRLEEGSVVELFDDAGQTASGALVFPDGKAAVQIDQLNERTLVEQPSITIAAAIPKGERADWMIEKLSELGVTAFIPLATERSVVVPEGTHKIQRWQRIATESAKQSRRHGVMRIEPVANLETAVITSPAICLATEIESALLPDSLKELREAVTLLIGPEGGWTRAELERFKSASVKFARLTQTILRTETAAVAAAAVAAMLLRCS